MKNKTESKVFDALVQDDEDHVGLFAYALYRKHKMTFIDEFKSKHSGKKVSKEIIESFTDNEILKIQEYRDKSFTALYRYAYIMHFSFLDEKDRMSKGIR